MTVLPLEPEFSQAYNELASTLEDSTLFQKYPELRTALSVVSIPERVVQFRVVWEDDSGALRVNRGYRIQFSSALGPYKGGLRLHPSVNLSILKFLGFEQIFKNALTGLNMGGAKGGADFDPKGKSDAEIRRFCVAFMTELSKHIGADTDVPAGDIGVGGREIGYMFGTYRKLRNRFEGVLTGKGLDWGGSLIRPEATGYGLVYYVSHMLEYAGTGGWAGKRVAISGSGNVAQYAALKVMELGGTVVSVSDSRSALVAVEGGRTITEADIQRVMDLKDRRRPLSDLVEGDAATTSPGGLKHIPGARPWCHVGKVDVALPCATENEVSREEADALIAAGCRFVAEGSNMGCEQGAIDVFETNRRSKSKADAVWYAPGKAANCGGVAVSGLEMGQNSSRLAWTREKVDKELAKIMENAFLTGLNTAKEYVSGPEDNALPSLVAGSNIAGFVKVARAMQAQGDWW